MPLAAIESPTQPAGAKPGYFLITFCLLFYCLRQVMHATFFGAITGRSIIPKNTHQLRAIP